MTNPTTHKLKVITGQGRGQKILGYPTLNLTIPKDFNYKLGIYAGWVYIEKTPYKGAFHYGPIPTFNSHQNSLEVFILNTDIPTPPPNVEIELVKYLRPIKAFETPQQLTDQITLDVAQTNSILRSSTQRTII